MTFIEEIKRPFNVLTLLLGLAGLAFGLYAYFVPRTDKAISYVFTGPSLIYDAKAISPKLHLVESDGTSVAADTYLVNFTFWNSGLLPIENPDVRKPVWLIFDGVEKILDYKIVQSIDQDVAHFAVSVPPGFKNIIQLDWKHFDPKKAVTLQAIFSQATKPKISISTDIVGVSGIKPGLAHNGSVKSNYLVGGFMAAIGIWLGAGAFSIFKPKKTQAKIFDKVLGILLGAGCLAAFILAIWIALDTLFLPQCPI